VRLKVTLKVKLFPNARDVGHVELFTTKIAFPAVYPTSLVIAMFAVQVTARALESPIATCPNSSGELQVRGSWTGEPYA